MEYETIIGLETHVELSTQSKIFCGCANRFGGAPNTRCCPVCLGLPGALPSLNETVVDYAVTAGLALHCRIHQRSFMDRKNYFYPDLVKGYQITQNETPICSDGYLEIETNGAAKRIRINRIHMEEDAGKLLHKEDGTGSLVDYNRAGVPLLEIVTEPDLRSPEESKLYLETLVALLRYLGISDCKMQEGSVRCDVNVSLRPKGKDGYGIRCEMKNINSFRGVMRSIAYESNRQMQLLKQGKQILQWTRRWDDVQGLSVPLREKEAEADYRYFQEPDLLPVVVPYEHLEQLKHALPELPAQKAKRYQEKYGLTNVDAALIGSSRPMAAYFEACLSVEPALPAAVIAHWLLGDVSKERKELDVPFDAFPVSPKRLTELLRLLEHKKVSGAAAKLILHRMCQKEGTPEALMKEMGLEQVNGEEALCQLVQTVLEENTSSVSDYKKGKKQSLGFLMGQAMRKSGGSANPQMIRELLLRVLEQ